MTKPSLSLIATALLGAFPSIACAQLVVSDNLKGGSATLNWNSLNGACLTAGNGAGTIPACDGLQYYNGRTLVGGTLGRLPDAAGSGALRLTNGDTAGGGNGDTQTGAVVSGFTFPSNQGVKVTFSTVTYGGDGYNNADGVGSGADGISFFLMDGAQPSNVGALGGSLGYSCSNVNAVYDGVVGAYIGLGIDEYGNFTNPGDNTATGAGALPGSITLRGAGNVAWSWLNANYPAYYPAGLTANQRRNAVQRTCRTGLLQNASGAVVTRPDGSIVAVGSIPVDANRPNETILDYPLLATARQPAAEPLFNQQAINTPLRANAIPITYGLSITNDGLLSLSYSYNGGVARPVMTDQSITASNGPVPATFRFGFSSGTGGGSNVHEITCFKAEQINVSSSSAGTNVQQLAPLQVGTQLYSAFYHPQNWWGQLTATNLVYNATTNTLAPATTANWDASCVLTGGACTATGANTTLQAPNARTILSWSGSAGIPFAWNSLASTQQTALGSSDRLAYLRGDRTNEVTTSGAGTFRKRDGVLGDIMDSSPTWVGFPTAPYAAAWKDTLFPTTAMPEAASAAQTYAAFKSANATRTNVVYAGANDGFLHGFRAGSYNAAGAFDTSTSAAANDGRELLSYMPAAVLNMIHPATPTLDYSAPSYAHNSYVDATPGTGDLFYGNAWHTWLVGGLGAGGNAGGVVGNDTAATNGVLYALDITDPATFSQGNASSLVLGEWTSSSIGCVNSSTCGQSLGSVYGTPIIRRLHDGQWAVIFGNGFNSVTGTAGIFVMSVNPTSGSRSFRFIDTGETPTTAGVAKNGIAYVSAADLDGDHVTDYVYGGDLFGNVWRFDLTSATPSSWSVSKLFSTGGKPITTRVTVTSTLPPSGPPRLIVGFGTGHKVPQTLTAPLSYASGTQSIYGIWDWNMGGWNSKLSAQYASLTGSRTIAATDLQQQTATDAAGGFRTVSRNDVCWYGSTTCASNNTKLGWILNLPGTTEQIVYNPVIVAGVFVVNTTIPPAGQSQVLNCTSDNPTGYSMAIDVSTGGAPQASFFAPGLRTSTVALNGLIGSEVVAGSSLNGTGTFSFYKKPGTAGNSDADFACTQTVDGQPVCIAVSAGGGGPASRLSWIKLR